MAIEVFIIIAVAHFKQGRDDAQLTVGGVFGRRSQARVGDSDAMSVNSAATPGNCTIVAACRSAGPRRRYSPVLGLRAVQAPVMCGWGATRPAVR